MLYTAADNAIIVRLCDEHINEVPDAVPINIQSERCENGCAMVGHCCRTAREDKE